MYEQINDQETELNVETSNVSHDIADVHFDKKDANCRFH